MSLAELRSYYQRMMAIGNGRAQENAGVFMQQYTTDRGLDQYARALHFPPVFNERCQRENKGLFQTIEEGLAEVVAKNNGSKYRLLDVGCGRAHFLLDIFYKLSEKYDKETLSGHLDLVGLTIGDARELPDENGRYFEKYPNIREELEQARISYIIGDARTLKRVLRRHGDGKFDCIVANQSLFHIHPQRIRLKVIKEIYDLLNLGGFAALQRTSLLPDNGLPKDRSGLIKQINDLVDNKGVQMYLSEDASLFVKKNDQPFYFPALFDDMGQMVAVGEE